MTENKENTEPHSKRGEKQTLFFLLTFTEAFQLLFLGCSHQTIMTRSLRHKARLGHLR